MQPLFRLSFDRLKEHLLLTIDQYSSFYTNKSYVCYLCKQCLAQEKIYHVPHYLKLNQERAEYDIQVLLIE